MNTIIDLKSKIDKEYLPLVNDLIKMGILLLTVNFLMFMSNPKKNKFMSESYVQLTIFVLLGISTYWLVIKPVVKLN
jgi:hypothetical protein